MSFWTNIKRVSRYGFIGFIRNGLVSVAAVFILVIALFFQANLMISNAAMTQTLEELKQKVGITVYFQPAASEEQAMATKQSLEALPEIALVSYTSRDQALADFRERHKNDQLTLQALDELGENPLGASLDVQAKEPSQYETVAAFLDARRAEGASGIDRVNFSDNKLAIERLAGIIDSSSKNGITKEIILGICAARSSSRACSMARSRASWCSFSCTRSCGFIPSWSVSIRRPRFSSAPSTRSATIRATSSSSSSRFSARAWDSALCLVTSLSVAT